MRTFRRAAHIRNLIRTRARGSRSHSPSRRAGYSPDLAFEHLFELRFGQAEMGIRAFSPDDLRATTQPLLDWLAATGCARVAIHFDVDTIDSNEIVLGLGAEPGGLTSAQVRRIVGDIDAVAEVVGITVAEFIPRQGHAPAAAPDRLSAAAGVQVRVCRRSWQPGRRPHRDRSDPRPGAEWSRGLRRGHHDQEHAQSEAVASSTDAAGGTRRSMPAFRSVVSVLLSFVRSFSTNSRPPSAANHQDERIDTRPSPAEHHAAHLGAFSRGGHMRRLGRVSSHSHSSIAATWTVASSRTASLPRQWCGVGVRRTRMLLLGIRSVEAFGCLCPERIAGQRGVAVQCLP
jgi:Arginase family